MNGIKESEIIRKAQNKRKMSISDEFDFCWKEDRKYDRVQTRDDKKGAQSMEADSPNNLDRFLDDLYHTELRMKMDKNEVKFIKRGIEHLVENIAGLVYEHGREEIEDIMADYSYAYPGTTFLDQQKSILKVGSMYDKTRNTFPDQIDLILVLFTFYCESDHATGYTKFGYTYKEKFNFLHSLIRKLVSKDCIAESLIHRNAEENGQEIRLDKYIRMKGCSSRLQFSYENRHSIVSILVDIVIATKRVDPHLSMKHLSPVEPFNIEMAKTGSVLYVNEKLSFTQTEVTFVKRVMSPKHRKTYRILKHLVNGHNDGEVLDKLLLEAGFQRERITSQMIKIEMIHHHCNCQKSDMDAVSVCVLDVLNNFRYYDSNNVLPSLSHDPKVAHFYKSVDKQRAIENMFFKLYMMQISEKPYSFTQNKITPVAKSLMDNPNKSVIQGPTKTKTKLSDWLLCLGNYCINLAGIVLAVLLFVVFIAIAIYQF